MKNAYANHTGFGGVAVHDYAGYVNLAKNGTATSCTSKGLWLWDYKIATTAAYVSGYFCGWTGSENRNRVPGGGGSGGGTVPEIIVFNTTN